MEDRNVRSDVCCVQMSVSMWFVPQVIRSGMACTNVAHTSVSIKIYSFDERMLLCVFKIVYD